MAPGDELAFICEIPKERLFQIYIQERPLDFGYILTNREEVPRGPYFTEEPQEVIFDLSGRSQTNDISLRCVAAGQPPPTYQWFKVISLHTAQPFFATPDRFITAHDKLGRENCFATDNVQYFNRRFRW